MQKFRLIVLIIFVFFGLCYGNWLEFNAGCPAGSSPVIQYGETTSDFITFDVELQGLQSEILIHNSTEYFRFNQTPGTVPMKATGYPELPYVTCFVAVPDGVNFSLSSSFNCVEKIDCSPVYPAPRDSLVHEEGVTYIKEFFEKEPLAYSSTEWYPANTAEISGEFRLRDQRVAIVNIYPVQYLASEDSLRVWSDIQLSVEFDGASPVWNQAGLGYYDHFIGDKLIGYSPDISPVTMGLPGGSVFRHEDTLIEPPFVPDYVIIVAPGLDGTLIDNFASYRASLNSFDVLIANVSDVIEGYGTTDYYFVSSDIIRDYTEALWNWGSPGNRPTYLLLIGDHDEPGCTTYDYCLPTEENGSTTGEGNDEWLVYFDEPRELFSSFPDMIVGRLPARDTVTLQSMLSLIESYESEATLPYSENLLTRRRITRLTGTVRNKDAFITEDTWNPSVGWTDSLRTWMGYSWDNYYCGDGEDTRHLRPSNPDGSSMTSADWVNACNTVFQRGSQVAFYSDHGDFHMLSAGLNWDSPAPEDFGTPDSTFDNLDVMELTPDANHWSPFLILLCCTAGTFNHTAVEHESLNTYGCLCYNHNPVSNKEPYDFTTDCLAEAFIKNTDSGAIGVFAGSNSSGIYYYTFYGKGILSAIFEQGITRTGDAILASRLQYIDQFIEDGTFCKELGQFNLLGDPAVDIGDRIKFRNNCDLIIAPSDLEINKYPTANANLIFPVTVRNAGWLDAGSFDVTLEIAEGVTVPEILTIQCAGLAAGAETTLKFQWNNTWFTPPGTLTLTASANDPGGLAPDSWMPNNSATVEIDILDFYPNESGWPVRAVSSVIVPPVLCDFDGAPDHNLEIVVTTANQLEVFSVDSPEAPIWESGYYPFFYVTSSDVISPTIPVAGNVIGDDLSEIVIDGKNELMIFNNTSTEPIFSFTHSWEGWQAEHTVALADFVPEADFEQRDEIVLIRGDELFVFDIVNDNLVALRTKQLPNLPISIVNFSNWPLLGDLNDDGSPEIVINFHYREIMLQHHSKCYVYDYVTDNFVSEKDWSDVQWRTIPSVGSLPLGQHIALPTDEASEYHSPMMLLDAGDLTTNAECHSNPNLDSYHVPYSIMVDWDPLTPGLDRVIANTENQCFAWKEDGSHATGYPESYSSAGTAKPPFPALGELDDSDLFEHADVVSATREGVVYAISSSGLLIETLGFPYTLPSSILGGFVIADLDNDNKVEIVFGTTDNYIHIWELGRCEACYAPWTQCQHDAARTGVLEE